AETVLQLAGSPQGEATDLAAFREELAGLIARYRNLSLREIQLGPLLQEVTAIAVRNSVRVPASLALTGKAFAQMQLVAAELDPTLDPFAVAQTFVLRRFVKQLSGSLDPRKVFYEAQKTRQRVLRLIEAVEMATGARPGGSLQVGFRSEGLEASIGRLGDRLALGLGLGGALVAAAMTANSRRLPPWVPTALGGLGAALGARLVVGERKRTR
ncbi:MAG TPA: universal stress protein, partial [Dehalococcoidia bacterium]|nr:universal stress protein [Dehalococcoidia bacterium]